MSEDVETKPRPVPSPTACIRAWKDLVDMGYQLALANLLRLGKTREEAWRIIAGWVERDNQERTEAVIRAFGGRARDGDEPQPEADGPGTSSQ